MYGSVRYEAGKDGLLVRLILWSFVGEMIAMCEMILCFVHLHIFLARVRGAAAVL